MMENEMQADQVKKGISPGSELEPAFTALAQIIEELESLNKSENNQEVQAALEESLKMCEQAREIFLAHDQPWLAAWTDLKKASLHAKLAQMANYLGRAVQAHSAMELVNGVLEALPTYPFNLDLAANIYIGVIDTLFWIRSLFQEPEQLEALDDLIRGVSENLGEAQAMDFLYRAEANDLNFTAGILETLAELEEDSRAREELKKASQELYGQAEDYLSITSAPLPYNAREGK
jgi:hypothetical protein